MKYVKVDVPRESGSPGQGIRPKDSITLIDVEDVSYMPERDEAGVVIEEDIILKEGAYPVRLYMTPGTTEVTESLEGDPDQEGSTPSVKFNHPGNSQKVREFKANAMGKKFIVIVGYCSGKPTDIIGDLCNPCQMTAAYTGNNDSSVNEFTFAQISAGAGIGIYEGSIPAVEPVAVVEGSTINFTTSGQYQLTSTSGNIAEISGGTAGALLTLVGSASGAPTLKAVSGKILLKGGADFKGSAGSQISLRAFDTGADGIVWIEQSRFGA